MKRPLAILLGILFFTWGCTFIPEYHRPRAPIPKKWPEGPAYQKVEETPKSPGAFELGWKDFFTDRKLQQVIEIALKNNRDLRLSALNVEKARALYGVRRAELFPVVTAGGSGAKIQRSSDFIYPGEPRQVERFEANLGITSWEIDFFGRIRSLEKKALEEYLATDQARRSVRISLISEVARVYLTLAADNEKLKIAQSTLETQKSIYALIDKQYEVGLVTELDLRRAQTQVDAARRAFASYTQLVARDKNALNLLAGKSIPEGLLPATLDQIAPPEDISPGLSSEVLLLRPDIMAAEHQLKAAYAYIGAARSAFFPRISLTTALGTASDELSGLFTSGTDTWNYAGQSVMPIFDARTWAAYRVSKAQRKIALASYERAIQTAFREVADTLAVKGTIGKQLKAQESMVRALSQTYRLSLERYQNGIDSYLSVLDAQRSLFQAQQTLTSLRLLKLVNDVRLYAVLGGGGR